jgi:hypothetical protein
MKATQLSKGCLDTIQHNGVGGKNETNIVQVLEARVKEQPKGKSLTLKFHTHFHLFIYIGFLMELIL